MAKTRFTFIDLLRGLVLLIMIEVHVFNIFLLPEIKSASWYHIINFINGLVAPSFLFVSGAAFVFSSLGKLDEQRKFGYAFWKRISRIGLIFLAGYLMHLPSYSLSGMLAESTNLAPLYQIDVLQCIGAGLLSLFLLRLVILSDKVFYWVTAIIAFAIIIVSPFIYHIDFSMYMPKVLAGYMNKQLGAQFPIFPWMGFMYLGVLYTRAFLYLREKNLEKKFIDVTLIAGVVLIIVGHLNQTGIIFSPLAKLRPNPLFFFLRVGYVLLLLSSFRYYELWFPHMKNKILLEVSRESLFVYCFHLFLLYTHRFSSESIADVYKGTADIWTAIGVTLLLCIVMVFLAKGWGYLKNQYPKGFSYGFRIGMGLLLLSILLT